MERILTVSQLNEYVRKSLAADPMLSELRLRGEISNFKRHSSGHLYFSLKDEEARVACVMFRSQAMLLRISPRDGMRVVLSGSAALYAAFGQYQVYVMSMRDDGVGELYERFERLKSRLMGEGLFDAGRKKPLPLLPQRIGIVTSATGAVLHDIQ
ncbi:MAG: exodeoxyribonuclease VII large subunit, partial [Clostridia bacterium]|nr:exodeoxyribonuclease VII large subunit [Clostridia bacterium]